MTGRERRWCAAYSLVLILVTTLPVWIAFRSTGSEWRFSGFLLAVEDGNSYIAKMQLGAAGAWLFRSPYTAMEQRGVIAFLPYLLLGKLAAPPEIHQQLVLLFHLFRVAMVPLVVIAVYRLASLFLDSAGSRRWATILGTAGGGLGWVLTFTGAGGWLSSLPLDFISPESFGFLALLALPHLILTRALLLFALSGYLKDSALGKGGWRAGILLAISTLVQPLGTLTAFAVVAAHQILLWLRNGRDFLRSWRARWLPGLWKLALPSLPLLLYYFVSSLTDPYLQVWTAQNQLPSPHPLHYLLAYGLALPFALPAAIKSWRASSLSGLLLVGWVAILPILAYFPYPVQRRLPEGVWIALSLLAISGLSGWVRYRQRMRWLLPGLVGISMLSSLALVIGSIGVASEPARPAFITRSDEQAFRWLRQHTGPGSVVLASYGTSNALPAWAPVRVLVGLGPESAYQETLIPQVEAFFDDGMSMDERRSFLDREGVNWIVAGPLEAKLGDWQPGADARVSLQYSEAGYRIYKVGGGP